MVAELHFRSSNRLVSRRLMGMPNDNMPIIVLPCSRWRGSTDGLGLMQGAVLHTVARATCGGKCGFWRAARLMARTSGTLSGTVYGASYSLAGERLRQRSEHSTFFVQTTHGCLPFFNRVPMNAATHQLPGDLPSLRAWFSQSQRLNGRLRRLPAPAQTRSVQASSVHSWHWQ